MKHLFFFIGLVVFSALRSYAVDFVIDRARYMKVQDVEMPIMLDSVDNSGAKFDGKNLLKIPTPLSGEWQKLPITIPASSSKSVHKLSFAVENRDFAKAAVVVEGVEDFILNVDGAEQKSGEELSFTPATHNININILTEADSTYIINIKIQSKTPEKFISREDGCRMFVHEDVMHGTRVSNLSLSPAGKWMLATFSTTHKGGKRNSYTTLIDTKNGVTVRRLDENVRWMPKTEKYYTTRPNIDNSISLIAIDPLTAQEEIISSSIPNGNFFFSPDEENLIYTIEVEGPKETSNGYLILEPDDRQPGWRNRTYPALYNLKSGKYSRLTVNTKPLYLTGISNDGKRILLQSNRSRLERRPTSVSSIFILDLPTMAVDTIVADGEFINTCILSPNGKKIIVSASPEAFGRVGCTTDSTVVPSMIQTELYLIDTADKIVKPLTRRFDPNVQDVIWSSADDVVYFTAENRDMISLYKLNPYSGEIVQLPMQEELIRQFDVANSAPVLAYRGQSASNPDALYVHDLKKGFSRVITRPSEDRLSQVDLQKCQDWNFTNSRGDTIYGRYYLPDNFDPEKKYPVIVYYYGGCSPTSRSFDSRYPFHAYAALGYVVYVIQPSGATGFGQEFASRHVSTAGEGVAQDIIEGTRKFLEAHPYTDPQKVGCLGASYGGFMTQYLQTVTDIFAAAVSHAGISDHTSYWGEGYWGYNYSETSMGDNKPWTNPDLYVKQSPLYRADKIHTPILFVHGDSDHNVPVGESIQLFTALKLLGQETALVQIPGEDHWILGYDNQKKWQETIFAWFAKYLKDDSEWWDALYPKNNL